MVSMDVQEVRSMRTTLTDPRLHHRWAFYVAVALLAVALLVLLHGDVAQGIALA
jgi:uncharacterized membrane protein YjjP (DUF1212 family)